MGRILQWLRFQTITRTLEHIYPQRFVFQCSAQVLITALRLVKPAFGVDFPLSKGSIFTEIAYKYQARKFDLVTNNMNYSQISFGIGYTF
ncbi:hypothetical protein DXD27_09085 [Bacteroides intestinalis]|uniref:hypothetical protein n=1 Tax=Bacteroides intestinalis TaxID=329854 RepID=UPI000E441838|nr:hypothetical protein [Bacteroides intestinalis]RGK25383.1 hypothetical protein DXD27_09085 [Bacteroides intestinalis]